MPPAPEIRPFTDEHLDGAGRLLAARHAAHRRHEPLLPARYEDPAAARAEVEALWRGGECAGSVCLREGRVTGFLVGSRKSDETWGPNVWVEAAGHAAEEPEDVRDLYAAAAAAWVEDGRTGHYAVVPAHDGPLLDAWFRLGFGQQHALALRELPGDAPWPDGVREVRPEDVDAVLELIPLLDTHHRLAPVFSALPPEDPAALRDELLEEIADPRAVSLVVERDGRLVGHLLVVPVELSSGHVGPARPDGLPLLAFAATRPEVRGSGAGAALTDAAFAWARGQGHQAMVVDWRVTNLLASRFWPARGFRPTFLRLHRLVGLAA